MTFSDTIDKTVYSIRADGLFIFLPISFVFQKNTREITITID